MMRRAALCTFNERGEVFAECFITRSATERAVSSELGECHAAASAGKPTPARRCAFLHVARPDHKMLQHLCGFRLPGNHNAGLIRAVRTEMDFLSNAALDSRLMYDGWLIAQVALLHGCSVLTSVNPVAMVRGSSGLGQHYSDSPARTTNRQAEPKSAQMLQLAISQQDS